MTFICFHIVKWIQDIYSTYFKSMHCLFGILHLCHGGISEAHEGCGTSVVDYCGTANHISSIGAICVAIIPFVASAAASSSFSTVWVQFSVAAVLALAFLSPVMACWTPPSVWCD